MQHTDWLFNCGASSDKRPTVSPLRVPGAAHGIGIIVDIHATNGSQNGFDHSAPVVVDGTGLEQWDSNTPQPTPSYLAQEVALVSTLAARYGASPALLGFSQVSEPRVRGDVLLRDASVAT